MNLKLTEVVSDLTGMGIIKAILQGERDPKALAKLRDRRCQESAETIALALQGTWQEEHLFELKQSLELYPYYHQQIGAGDQVIEAHLKTLALTLGRAAALQAARAQAQAQRANVRRPQPAVQMAGVDLTVVEGIEASTAAVVLSEETAPI